MFTVQYAYYVCGVLLMNYPKILRNNLLEGIGDTFDILYGHHSMLYKFSGREDTEDFRYGATDLFVFPLIASALIEFGFPTRKITGTTRYCVDETKANLLRTAVGILGIVLQLPRITLVVCLTALFLPIIFSVHILKYPYVNYLEKKFYHLKGEIIHTDNSILSESSENKDDNLAAYVNKTRSSLNDLQLYGERNIVSYSKDNDIPYTGMYSYLTTCNPKLFFKPAEENDSEGQNNAIKAGQTLGILN